MSYDILQSLPPRSIGTQDAENRRIERVADEIRRRCGIHEAQSGTGKTTLNISDAVVKEAEPAPQIAIDTFMAALGFDREERLGRYSNGEYTVWDLLPRNVLRDKDGDIFVVDAEIKSKSRFC